MVANFLAGGAVVNAFAAQAGAEVVVVDAGVAADLEPAPGLLPRKVARGTADFTRGPAMSREQAVTALTAGIEVAATWLQRATAAWSPGTWASPTRHPWPR